MNKYYNKKLVSNSKLLRKNMTKEERKLWYQFLKNLPLTIHRQKIINNYIVDFYCAKTKIVIELDGSQHYEEKGKRSDIERDSYLKSLGIKVLRYSNLDVNKNFEGVCKDITKHISNTSSGTSCHLLLKEKVDLTHLSASLLPSHQGKDRN